LKNASRNSSTDQPELQKLRALAANPLTNDPLFKNVLTAEAARRARRFVAGVTAYQNHPARRNISEGPVVWQDGTTRLLDYNPAWDDAPPLLVIPSLINRFDILDLERNHSFLRALAAEGFRPYVVDWGVPGEAEKNFSLDDYITKRLFPALDHIGGKVNILGYCMGGLFALALAALRPDKTRSLSLFATPWDFHKPDAAYGKNFLALDKEIAPQTDATGHLPVDIIQGLFAALQPTLTIEKFGDFADMDPVSAEARRFVLLEDWLQDGVPLAAKVAHETARDWYGENLPANFKWKIGETLIDPRALAISAYVAVPGRDRIVPPESSLPLAKLFPRAALHQPMTGHIGMMASAKAPQQVWAPYFHWLKEHA
jgi:class III poly(R)-hydroxyalkanoic acid synthase PhaC subunit